MFFGVTFIYKIQICEKDMQLKINEQNNTNQCMVLNS